MAILDLTHRTAPASIGWWRPVQLKYLSLEYLDPQIRVVGPAAIVRFHWVSESQSVADGKRSNTNLHILMNWQKQGADWKLLSRAATKLS